MVGMPTHPNAQADHPNVRAVQDALLGADAHDGSGRPSEVRLLPEAVHTAAAAAAAVCTASGSSRTSLGRPEPSWASAPSRASCTARTLG